MQEKSTLLSLFIDNEVSDQVIPLRCKIMSLAPGVKVHQYIIFWWNMTDALILKTL
jgi:hypothetical protein